MVSLYLFIYLNSKEHPQDDRWGLASGQRVSPLYYVDLRGEGKVFCL